MFFLGMIILWLFKFFVVIFDFIFLGLWILLEILFLVLLDNGVFGRFKFKNLVDFLEEFFVLMVLNGVILWFVKVVFLLYFVLIGLLKLNCFRLIMWC